MGLEINEFVAEVEHVFRVAIPGKVAVAITTPRELARFIGEQLPIAEKAPAAEIEAAVLHLLEKHACRGSALTVDTHFQDIFP
jgi:hypothetical protein